MSRKTGIPKGRINGWEQQGTKPKRQDYELLFSFFENLENQLFSKNENNSSKNSQSNLPLTKNTIPPTNNSTYNEAEEIGEIKSIEESKIEYISGNEFIDIGNGRYQMLIPLIEQYA